MAGLAQVDLDSCDEPSLRAVLGGTQQQIRRLQAHLTAIARQLTTRQAARLDPNDHAPARARQRAQRDTQDELAHTLHLTPTQAKDTVAAGTALAALSAATSEAFTRGQLTPRHVRIMARTLQQLSGVADLDPHTLETRLLAAATSHDPVAFARHCRQLVAQADTNLAQQELERLHRRRYGTLTHDTDGMVRVSAGFAGADAELVATAIEVFRTPDTPGELRTPTQRTADAILEAIKTGREHADSTDHGNRPHVFVHIHADQLHPHGVAQTTFMGTLPTTELGPLLEDCVPARQPGSDPHARSRLPSHRDGTRVPSHATEVSKPHTDHANHPTRQSRTPRPLVVSRSRHLHRRTSPAVLALPPSRRPPQSTRETHQQPRGVVQPRRHPVPALPHHPHPTPTTTTRLTRQPTTGGTAKPALLDELNRE